MKTGDSLRWVESITSKKKWMRYNDHAQNDRTLKMHAKHFVYTYYATGGRDSKLKTRLLTLFQIKL